MAAVGGKWRTGVPASAFGSGNTQLFAVAIAGFHHLSKRVTEELALDALWSTLRI